MCETAKRFFSAMVTDALMMRIIGDDHPDPAGLAEELGEQVVGVAAKELGELSQENRVALLDMQLERFKQTIATAARYAYRTKAHRTIDMDAVTPELVARVARERHDRERRDDHHAARRRRRVIAGVSSCQ